VAVQASRLGENTGNPYIIIATRVYVEPVSGAPETAAIAPSLCRSSPPAVAGDLVSRSGLENLMVTRLWVSADTGRFCGLAAKLGHLYKAQLPPSTNHNLHLLFLALALSHSRDSRCRTIRRSTGTGQAPRVTPASTESP
jgi:hypothetical protein